MPTTVQVELDPEYLKWPRSCVCCGAPDERDLEIAVPSTDIGEHESDLIMEVRIPYCLACYTHSQMKIAWGRIVAICVALAFLATISQTVLVSWSNGAPERHAVLPTVVVACAVAFVGYVVWELLQIRRAMRPSCTAPRGQIIFFHPTNSRMSTISFTNGRIADQFRGLNRYNVVHS